MFKCGHVGVRVKRKIIAKDIGHPTDMRREIHVTKNPETGKLEGLPKAWSKFWDNLSSSNKQKGGKVDPEEAKKTAKFYTEENHKLAEEPSRTSTEIKKKKGEE